ncbi:MAG: RidA family protein, partial [Vicinamibacterales bacterium]
MAELGLAIPAPLQLPPGLSLPFPWVRVFGDRAFISGHGPQLADGTLAGPFGKVGADLTIEAGYEAARLV